MSTNFGKIAPQAPTVKTISALHHEIVKREEFLKARELSRSHNPKVTRLATYDNGSYIVYQAIGKKSYIVKAICTAYEARSKADVKRIIAADIELLKLRRLAEVNDWCESNETFSRPI